MLRNLCLDLARQDGQDRKKRNENHATKVTKIWDEQNNNFVYTCHRKRKYNRDCNEKIFKGLSDLKTWMNYF